MTFTLTPPTVPPRADSDRMRAPPALSPEQLRRVARLHNRHTLYEAEIIRPDGTKALLAYCGRRSKQGLIEALDKRAPHALRFLGAPRHARVERERGSPDVKIEGGGMIRFSGRTQREAIIEGELQYVGDVP